MNLRVNWADKILVWVDGESLVFTGTRLHIPETDLLKAGYAEPKKRGSKPLYLEILEQSNLKEMISIGQRYGPYYGEVLGNELISLGGPYNRGAAEQSVDFLSGEKRDDGLIRRFIVTQSISLLRQEISALRAFLYVFEVSRRDPSFWGQLKADERKQEYERVEKELSVLEQQTNRWLDQLENEKWIRATLGARGQTGWSWSEGAQDRMMRIRSWFGVLSMLATTGEDDEHLLKMKPSLELRSIVAMVLNAFPASLVWGSSEVIQHAGGDLIFGIRPLIFHMIREDLLSDAEIRLCRNKSCGQYFRAQRHDQTCCTPECSEKVRFQKYYQDKRKPARDAMKRAHVSSSKNK